MKCKDLGWFKDNKFEKTAIILHQKKEIKRFSIWNGIIRKHQQQQNNNNILLYLFMHETYVIKSCFVINPEIHYRVSVIIIYNLYKDLF
jgi:hypothetical protein